MGGPFIVFNQFLVDSYRAGLKFTYIIEVKQAN